MRYNRSMPERILSWVFFYIFVGILVAAAVTLFFPGRGVLLSALMPRAERFTELYFEKHLELPKDVTFNTPFELEFTVHNLEGRDVTYPYQVTAIEERNPFKTVVLAKGSIFLSSGEQEVVPLTLKLPALFTGRVKVVVSLPNQKQEVFYWIEKPKLNFVSTASATPAL